MCLQLRNRKDDQVLQITRVLSLQRPEGGGQYKHKQKRRWPIQFISRVGWSGCALQVLLPSPSLPNTNSAVGVQIKIPSPHSPVLARPIGLGETSSTSSPIVVCFRTFILYIYYLQITILPINHTWNRCSDPINHEDLMPNGSNISNPLLDCTRIQSPSYTIHLLEQSKEPKNLKYEYDPSQCCPRVKHFIVALRQPQCFPGAVPSRT